MEGRLDAQVNDNGTSTMSDTDDRDERGGLLQTIAPSSCAYGSMQIPDAAAGENGDVDVGEQQRAAAPASYVGLLRTHRPYRLFLVSYLISRAGDWFSYVAAISTIERLLQSQAGGSDPSGGDGGGANTSKTAVSILVVVRLVPNVLVSALGGTLSDSRDRRESMMALDFCCAATVLLFLAAIRAESVLLVYVVAFLQGCLSGLYEPCRDAIIPLMVPDHDFLKKATTLSELTWSAMAAFGSGMGGLAVATLGISACFVLDSVSYVMSACLMWRIGGHWNAAKEEASIAGLSSLVGHIRSMVFDGVQYLRKSSFWPFVLVKSTGACVFGAADVLNVAFAEEKGHDESENDVRMGALFAFCGIGCLLGPLVADKFTDMKDSGSLLRAIVWAFAALAIGYTGMSQFAPFYATCMFTVVRSAGSSILWINSTLLLQKYCASELLGRISAVDYGMATVSEALSATLTGVLLDRFLVSARGVSSIMAMLGVIMCAGWLTFYARGGRGERRFPVTSSISDMSEGVGIESVFLHDHGDGEQEAAALAHRLIR